jgi:1-acyl-sn-glycerol-3-phosphate acyltransferase
MMPLAGHPPDEFAPPPPTTTTTTPAKRGWALTLARAYVRRAMRTRFDGVYVTGLETTRALCADQPVLFACNHVTWWDAFALVLIDEALGTDGAVLMDEVNLARLPFFGAIGALPIDTSGGPRVRRQLQDAARHLNAAGKTLWIFPQGRQRASHLRPLAFQPGLRLLARRAGVPVVPVSLAYPWRDAPAPALVMRFHAPIAPDVDVVRHAEDSVAAGLDHVDDDIDHGVVPGAVLVAPKARGTQDGLPARALRRLMGGHQ